ncbi:hypothetical protein CGQ24_10145 [Arthrobacter sp. 7749]|nr:hypothetical protein CGQ24_10145 [Arthrobacter sp. 7749]
MNTAPARPERIVVDLGDSGSCTNEVKTAAITTTDLTVEVRILECWSSLEIPFDLRLSGDQILDAECLADKLCDWSMTFPIVPWVQTAHLGRASPSRMVIRPRS